MVLRVGSDVAEEAGSVDEGAKAVEFTVVAFQRGCREGVRCANVTGSHYVETCSGNCASGGNDCNAFTVGIVREEFIVRVDGLSEAGVAGMEVTPHTHCIGELDHTGRMVTVSVAGLSGGGLGCVGISGRGCPDSGCAVEFRPPEFNLSRRED